MAKRYNAKRLLRELDALHAAGDVTATVATARRVRETAEQLERDVVRDARRAGVTWADIGALYDMSKQGAQQRFGGQVPEDVARTKTKKKVARVERPKGRSASGA